MCRVDHGRLVCCEDVTSDEHFDGREFCALRWRPMLVRPMVGRTCRRQATGESKPDANREGAGVEKNVEKHVGTDTLDDAGRRDIIAEGMQRFEGIAKTAPQQPAVERLSSRVISILGQNPSPYTLNGTNCYLVGTGRRRVLIDTGDNPALGSWWRNNHNEFMRHLKNTLAAEQCELEMILVTHLHTDHFGGVMGILNTFGRHIEVGMLEAPDHLLSLTTIRELRARGLIGVCEQSVNPFEKGSFDPSAGLNTPAPDFDASWDVAGRTPREIARDFWYHQHHASFYEAWADDTHAANVLGRKLKHGDVITVEGATLRVVRTPGHSENHAAFCLDEEHAMFSGDHVLGFGTTIMNDAYDYMASLDAMRRYAPTRLYPGHGPHITDGTGLLERYHAHRQSREDQIVALLADATEFGEGAFLPTSGDIAAKLYTRTSPQRMEQARENVERILLKLWREGRADVFSDRAGKVAALLPEVGYLRRLGDDLAWRLREQDDEAAARWREQVEAIVEATAGAVRIHDGDGDDDGTSRLLVETAKL